MFDVLEGETIDAVHRLKMTVTLMQTDVCSKSIGAFQGINRTVRADYSDWIGQGYSPPYFDALEVFKGQRKLAISGLKKLSGPPLISAAFL
jgi:hypothetical protein